jgi:hypothetical protein
MYMKACESVAEARRSIDSYFRSFNEEKRRSSPGKRTPDNGFYNTLPNHAVA